MNENTQFSVYIKPIANTIIYPHTYYIGDVLDNVFIPLGLSSIHTCRETFQTSYLRHQISSKSVTFALSIYQHCFFSEFLQFINVIENRLKIKGSIILHEVKNSKNLIVVTLNEWWVKSKIRQEFITILLRCYSTWVKGTGLASKQNKVTEISDLTPHINNILFSQTYFNETKSAVDYFLDGHNAMKKPFKADVGWHRRFGSKKEDNGNHEEVLVGLLSEQVVAINPEG